MKSFAILLPVLFSMNLMAAQPILNNNDIVTPTTLKYDVDGFEMWTIIPSDREETLKAFKTKCEETIPNRYAERIALLGVSKDDFVYSTKI